MDDLVVRELNWDSECFGIRVGELRIEGAPARTVQRALEASASGFDLVYLRGTNSEAMPDEVLRAFRGQHTDTRVTFELSPIEVPPSVAPQAKGEVRSVGCGEISDDLVALAQQAAEHSRFRQDERFRDAWVDKLYRIWIERSVARERADEVLVFADAGQLLGLYTIRTIDDTGILELFAVDRRQRGKGVGRALLVAGLEWMRDHRLARARVTTQLRNPVCRLYRELGYSLLRTEEIYHLWPRSGIANPRSLHTS